MSRTYVSVNINSSIKGDTLVVLDNREYLIRQKEAEAALMDAQGSKGVLHSNIETSETHIAETVCQPGRSESTTLES